MTAIVSDYKNLLYTREFSNDIPKQSNLIKRVALASIPFLCLHSSFRLPVSLFMGTARIWNSDKKDILGTSLAVIALASTIFQHRIGIIITTIHDLTIEINHVRKAETWKDASTSLVKILNQVVYLALITRGGLELSIIASITQAVVNLIQSKDEFKQGRWMEGVANLLLSGLKLHQTKIQYQQLKRNREIEETLKRVSVGELHEKFDFPSDHLPIGIEVNGIRIISWNVLNNAYIDWVIEKDSQGLNGSMISKLNIRVNENGLTLRDTIVAEMVKQMMERGHVVALQECGQPFLEYLHQKIPSGWEMIRSYHQSQENQEVLLYNKIHLSYQTNLSGTFENAYPSEPGRPIPNLYFASANGNLNIFNCHIPGDANKPCREELAKYIYEQHKEGSVTIAIGDNNFERHEMMDAYRKAGFTDFSLHAPWKTNIDPATKESKGIDCAFVVGKHQSRDLKPDEVIEGDTLKKTIQLFS